MQNLNEDFKNYYKERLIESILLEAANPAEPSAGIGGLVKRWFGLGKKPKKPLSPIKKPKRPPTAVDQNFIDNDYARKHFNVANLHLLLYKEIDMGNGIILRFYGSLYSTKWKLVLDPTKPPVRLSPRFDPNNPDHVRYVQEHGIGKFVNLDDLDLIYPRGEIPPALVPFLVQPSTEEDVTSEEIPGSEGIEAISPYRLA